MKKSLEKVIDERMSREVCENCRFFSPSPDDNEFGACHRYPPVVTTEMDEVVSYFPFIDPEAWCGEFQRRTQG